MKFTKLAAAMTLALAVSAAQAATATNTFNVTLTVTGTCDATAFGAIATSPVAFGTHTAAATSGALQATNGAGTTLKVQCSKGLPVTIGLKPASATAGASTGLGSMSNGTDVIAYQLTQPSGSPLAAAYVTNWGDIIGTNTLAITGNGLAVANGVNVPVSAKIAADQLNVSAGNYTEAVLATLNY